jgi:hypothetical protein
MFDNINIPDYDAIESMISRTLLQFRKSPVFIDTLAAIGREVQEFIDAALDVIKYRGPAEAIGDQLEAIGRIVGQLRVLVGFDTIAWFAPDKVYQGPDSSPAWVKNAPISGDYEANDGFYRQLIEAKVSRNFIQFGSVPEIQDFIKQALGIDIGFVRIDVMTIQVIVPDNTSLNIMTLLERYDDTDNAEHVYFLPLAAGVQIAEIIRISDLLDSSSSS